jgi:hypothetical protein
MAFHSCQAIQGVSGRSPHSATLSLPRSRPHTHFHSAGFRSVLPDRNQSSCQNTLTARHDVLLVRGMYNPRNLGSLKRVAPLRLSLCCGAPFLGIARLCAALGATSQDSRPQNRSMLGFELTRIIHEHFCCNRQSTATTSLRPECSPLEPSPYCTSTHRVLRTPRAGLATQLSDFATNRHE